MTDLFEPRFLLNKHLGATKERAYSSGTIKLIFSEVGTRCPMCRELLKWGLPEILINRDKIDEINLNPTSKDNQIAHIYGRKLFEQVGLPLNKKYHIDKEEDLDSYLNLIVLCGDCHSDYDNVKTLTYEKYLMVLNKKKEIYMNMEVDKYLYTIFEDFKNDFILYYDSLNIKRSNECSSYNKMKLEDKLEFNQISDFKSNDVISDVRNYYDIIKDLLANTPDGKKLITSFQDTYNILKTVINDKDLILDKYLEIFQDRYPKRALRVIVSYMIMICEVLDNVTE